MLMHFRARRALVALAVSAAGVASCVTTTTIQPNFGYGVWDGWGCSLSWWANVFGNRDDLADVIFTTKQTTLNGYLLPGLGMNIARYNVGGCTWTSIGGSAMTASPNIPAFKQIRGYWLNWYSSDPASSSWDWTADANQRAMLLKAQARGANLFEMFSNSPLWWMCYNHNPSGNANASSDNLQNWNYDEHAVYLATVAAYFRNHLGLTFTSVEPFNEPMANYWVATGNQEGCHFNISTQASVIPYLRSELDNLGLSSTVVSASDETAYDQAIATWNGLGASVRAKVGRVNTHGYQYDGGRRDLLHSAVNGKKLWNSEYGEGDATGMTLAVNLTLDLIWLHPSGWCYWQPFDSGGWGLIQSNPGDNWVGAPNPKYYVLAQYTRHIRPGMTVIGSPDGSSIVAYDMAGRKLVIVAYNTGSATSVRYDLTRFHSVSGPVTRWVTNTGGGDSYAKHTDLVVSGKMVTVPIGVNTVETIEVQNVTR